MKGYSKAWRIVAVLSIGCTSHASARAKDSAPVEVRRVLAEWEIATRKHSALSLSGATSVEVVNRNGSSAKQEAATYFGFVRGKGLLCDLGIVAFSWEGKERKLYDLENGFVYTIETTKNDLHSERLEPALEDGLEPEVQDELTRIASIALSEVKSSKDAAAALANNVASITWLPVIATDASKQLLSDATGTSIRTLDAKTTVIISYSYGRTTTLSFDNKSGMVTDIVVVFGEEELSNTQAGRVSVAWKRAAYTSEKIEVETELTTRQNVLESKAANFKKPKSFPAGPGESVVVPDLPRAKGLLGFLDHWVRVMLGEHQEDGALGKRDIATN
jgi:hypothetical protein